MNDETALEAEGISLSELMKILISEIPLIILCIVISLGSSWIYLTQVVSEYQTTTTLLVDPIKQSSTIGKVLSSDFFDTSKDIATEIPLITNTSNLLSALSQLDLASYVTDDGRTYEESCVLGNLKSKVSVTNVKNTNIVEISVRDQNPQFASDYANALALSFNHMLSNFSKDSKQSQLEFLEKQIPKVETQLQEANNLLYDYRFQTGIDFLANSTSVLVNHISYLSMKEKPLLLQIDKGNKALSEYEKLFGSHLPSLERYTSDEIVATIMTSYATAFEELMLYEVVSNNNFTNTTNLSVVNESINAPANSRIFSLNKQMQNSKRELLIRVIDITKEYQRNQNIHKGSLPVHDNISHTIVERITSELEADKIRHITLSFEHEFNKLPLIQKDLSTLMSDVESLESIRKELNSFREQIVLTVAAENNNVKIVSPAELPLSPISPNRLLIIAVSLLLGGAVGVLMSILLHMKDDSIRSLEEIQKIAGPSIPILGWTPLMKQKKNGSFHSLNLHVCTNHQSYLAQRYKQIASNLLYGNNKEHHVFVVTSSGMNEGKSSVTVNVGICLEKMGYKVLLIDSDIEFPSLERHFGLQFSKKGFVYFKEKGIPFEKSIIVPSKETPHLHIANPGKNSLVSSFGYKNSLDSELLLKLRDTYDYILIDVPPFEFAPEQIELIEHTDALLICTRMNICGKDELHSLLSQLNSYDKKIGGIVATGCTKENISYRANKYGNYYDSYLTSGASPSFVSSNKVAVSMFKKTIKERRKYIRQHEEAKGEVPSNKDVSK